jgi:hypothetical protein
MGIARAVRGFSRPTRFATGQSIKRRADVGKTRRVSSIARDMLHVYRHENIDGDKSKLSATIGAACAFFDRSGCG